MLDRPCSFILSCSSSIVNQGIPAQKAFGRSCREGREGVIHGLDGRDGRGSLTHFDVAAETIVIQINLLHRAPTVVRIDLLFGRDGGRPGYEARQTGHEVRQSSAQEQTNTLSGLRLGARTLLPRRRCHRSALPASSSQPEWPISLVHKP